MLSKTFKCLTSFDEKYFLFKEFVLQKYSLLKRFRCKDVCKSYVHKIMCKDIHHRLLILKKFEAT